MSVLSGKLFWGCLLILWGIILVLEKIIGKNIPIGRFLLAFILIYLGIYILFKVNKPNRIKVRTHIKTESCRTSSNTDGEYSVVFGKNIIDLSDIEHRANPIDINTVFATTDLYLSENKAYVIELSTFFGEVVVPKIDFKKNNDDELIIGDTSADDKIRLEINTVFGKTNIMLK